MSNTEQIHQRQPRADRDAIPSVTRVLREAGMLATFDFVSAEYLAVAAARGTAVHLAIELDAQGALDEASVDAQVAPYLAAHRRAMCDLEATIVWIEATEDERDAPLLYDHVWRFCGRPDAVLFLRRSGCVIVVDWKTGPESALIAPQVAAYGLLVARAWGIQAHGVASLHYRNDGSYRWAQLSRAQQRDAEDDFRSAVRVYHYRRRHGLTKAEEAK